MSYYYSDVDLFGCDLLVFCCYCLFALTLIGLLTGCFRLCMVFRCFVVDFAFVINLVASVDSCVLNVFVGW